MSSFFWLWNPPTIFHTHPSLPDDQLSMTFLAISMICSTATDYDYIMIIFILIMIIVLMLIILLMMQQKNVMLTSKVLELKNRLDMPTRVIFRVVEYLSGKGNSLNPEDTETHILLHKDLVERKPALLSYINNRLPRFPSSPDALAACVEYQAACVKIERSKNVFLTK